MFRIVAFIVCKVGDFVLSRWLMAFCDSRNMTDLFAIDSFPHRMNILFSLYIVLFRTLLYECILSMYVMMINVSHNLPVSWFYPRRLVPILK